ncbi:hypothetical protein NC653_002587 [Populus alba x Populus x berolinensis]|uniref:Uncharacterized protein n=1 Tax=Populus alba x Populus x berolinensis TaxID=444605 RepID=A0AAD6WJC1_9ROSI|nr:hypothetical protein NC653_002587 [Populus alba x Populus x berolinensis]
MVLSGGSWRFLRLFVVIHFTTAKSTRKGVTTKEVKTEKKYKPRGYNLCKNSFLGK